MIAPRPWSWGGAFSTTVDPVFVITSISDGLDAASGFSTRLTFLVTWQPIDMIAQAVTMAFRN